MKRMNESKQNTPLQGMGKRMVSFVLCLVMLFGFLPMIDQDLSMETEADAAALTHDTTRGTEQGTSTPTGYVLSVTTGANKGKDVQYIAIRYIDSIGSTRTEYLFPNYDSYANGIAKAKKYGTDKYRTDVASSFGITVDAIAGANLQTETRDMFYFETYLYPIQYLLGIDVFVNNGGSKADWTCREMALYKVNKNYGIKRYGYVSKYQYVDFDGELIAYAGLQNGTMSFNAQAGTPVLYRVGRKNNAKYWLTFNPKYRLPDTTYYYKDNNLYDQSYNSRYTSNKVATTGLTYSSTKDYLFTLDISDVYLGGFEELANSYGAVTNFKGMKLFETMTMQISYSTETGGLISFNLPFVLSCALWESTVFGDLRNQKFLGFAQQGEKICFVGSLPAIKTGTVPSITLKLGASSAKTDCGIRYASESANIGKGSDLGGLALNNISIYEYGTGTYEVKNNTFNNTTIDPILVAVGKNSSPTPLYTFTAKTAEGTKIAYNQSYEVSSFDAYRAGGLLMPKETHSTRYLVKIYTSKNRSSGTKDAIFVKYSYTNTAGNNVNVAVQDAEKLINDFYGYWPSNTSSYAYYAGCANAGCMQFIIEANDLAKLTSMTLSMGATSTDDYQFEKIEVYRTTAFGNRVGTWDSQQAGPVYAKDQTGIYTLAEGDDPEKIVDYSYKTDRTYSRDLGEIIGPIATFERKVLLQGGDSVNNNAQINFSDSFNGNYDYTDVDWNDYKEYMSYEDTKIYMGYTKARACYKVTIKVHPDDDTATATTGDSGSENMFYFQILYENGKTSGYVLANTQLTGDGFRSGYNESFYIYTNYDYGEIAGIRIIPDDLSSDSTVFDKLQIDEIQIDQQTNTSIGRTWKTGQVGWVDIDYHDEGAKSTATGQAGRTEAEITRTKSIEQSSYTMNFMFEVATGVYGQNVQGLTGTMTADIDYYDKNGDIQTESIDVYGAMYRYMNHMTAYREGKTYDEHGKEIVNKDGTKNAQCEVEYMMRPNHVNRFMVSLKNCREIVSITFYASSTVTAVWNCKSVKVWRVIGGSGELYQDDNDDYMMSNTSVLLTESTSDAGYSVYCPANAACQAVPIEFVTAVIPYNEETQTWTTTIGAEPKSKNDVLNVTLYMLTNDNKEVINSVGRVLDIDNYDLQCAFQYTKINETGKLEGYQVSTESSGNYAMVRDSANKCFYVNGIPANSMSSLMNMTVEPKDLAVSNPIRADYAIVQQVRSGVIINTYYFNFNYENCNKLGGVKKNPGTLDDNYNQQIATIAIYEQSNPATLGETYDIMACLNYTLKNDKSGAVYRSKYQYLSQQTWENVRYEKVEPAHLYRFTFNEPNIDKITGITFVATSEAYNVAITGACVGDYAIGADDSTTCVGWYSCLFGNFRNANQGTKLELMTTSLTANVTDNEEDSTLTVYPAVMKFKTADAGKNVESGTESPINLQMYYTDLSGNSVYTNVNDIRDYIINGTTQTGDVATMEMLVGRLDDMHYIYLEPKDELRTKANWKLESFEMAVDFGFTTKTYVRAVDENIVEGTGHRVNLSNITLSANVEATNKNGNVSSYRITEGEVSITVGMNQNITISPTDTTTNSFISGSFNDITVEAYRIDGTASFDESNLISTEKNDAGGIKKIVFNSYAAQANHADLNTTLLYQIIITSEELRSKQIVINASVYNGELNFATFPEWENDTENSKTQQQEQELAYFKGQSLTYRANLTDEDIAHASLGIQEDLKTIRSESKAEWDELVKDYAKMSDEDLVKVLAWKILDTDLREGVEYLQAQAKKRLDEKHAQEEIEKQKEKEAQELAAAEERREKLLEKFRPTWEAQFTTDYASFQRNCNKVYEDILSVEDEYYDIDDPDYVDNHDMDLADIDQLYHDFTKTNTVHNCGVYYNKLDYDQFGSMTRVYYDMIMIYIEDYYLYTLGTYYTSVKDGLKATTDYNVHYLALKALVQEAEEARYGENSEMYKKLYNDILLLSNGKYEDTYPFLDELYGHGLEEDEVDNEHGYLKVFATLSQIAIDIVDAMTKTYFNPYAMDLSGSTYMQMARDYMTRTALSYESVLTDMLTKAYGKDRYEDIGGYYFNILKNNYVKSISNYSVEQPELLTNAVPSADMNLFAQEVNGYLLLEKIQSLFKQAFIFRTCSYLYYFTGMVRPDVITNDSAYESLKDAFEQMIACTYNVLEKQYFQRVSSVYTVDLSAYNANDVTRIQQEPVLRFYVKRCLKEATVLKAYNEKIDGSTKLPLSVWIGSEDTIA